MFSLACLVYVCAVYVCETNGVVYSFKTSEPGICSFFQKKFFLMFNALPYFSV